MKKDLSRLDWNLVRAFLATVEEGSLSKAARRLNQTQPTLSRQIAQLEDQLTLTLFERVGKKLALTPTGEQLVQHAAQMSKAADAFSLSAASQNQDMQGEVTITGSDIMSVYFLPQAIAQLEPLAPKLAITIVASDELQNLQRREADIAVRHVRPTQPDLRARLVVEETARFYASEGYLARYGMPKTEADLVGHRLLGFGDAARMTQYMKDIFGLTIPAECFHHDTANGLVAWEMVRQGLGICVMSDAVAARTPGVKPINLPGSPMHFPTWLVSHRELHTNPKIRLVFDHLADFIGRAMAQRH